MKTITALIATIALAASAQVPKPGDFEVKPLPPQDTRPPRARPLRGARMPVVRSCGTNICQTDQPSTCVEVAFPETSWRTCISNPGRRSLTLGPTDLRRSPGSPWIRVLNEAGVADIFVPYHSIPWRLYDMESSGAEDLLPVTADDAGRNGRTLTLSGQSEPRVVAEVNDRGVAWLCKSVQKQIVRRGEELVLWGVLDAENYDFIIEYRLRDDGGIGFRVGATGYNNPFAEPDSTTDAHMHSVLWRADVDLNGAAGDSVRLVSHREPALLAEDVEEPFNSGREGVMAWDPRQFLTLAVEDSTVNVHGNPISYAVRAAHEGVSRHNGAAAGLRRGENFTQFDFAATRYKRDERDAFFDSAHSRYLNPDIYLLGESGFAGMGVSDRESVENTDVVLWYRTSAHHDPHDEDHAPGDPDALMTGITNVHWTGFDLEPRNLFDFNPLGGPSRTHCQ